MLPTVQATPDVVTTPGPALWLASLLPPGRPRRVSRMTNGGNAKYHDIKSDFGEPELDAHLGGRETYATTLDRGIVARLGKVDIDHGGRDALLAAYRRVRAAGLQAWATFVETPGGHSGGHITLVYAALCSAAGIEAQLRGILPEYNEVWPGSDQPVRLDFGYHRRARSWGEFWYLDDAGELHTFDLNHPQQRDAAIVVAMAVPGNPAPPPAPKSEPLPKPEPKPAAARVSPGEQGAARLSIADWKARTSVVAQLEAYGAVKTRNGLTCPCGADHGPGTKITIAPGGNVAHSKSNNPACPFTKPQYKRHGFDALNVVAELGYHGDQNAAMRAVNPPAARARQQRLEPPTAEAPEYLTPQHAERRRQDAARKRQVRQDAAAELRADVEARMSADAELTGADRAVLEALLTIAGERGWCRPSKERIAEMSGYSLGSVKRSLMKLEGRYFTSEGDGGGPNSTAVRTFLRGSSPAEPAAEMIPVEYRTCDHEPDQGACERGATAPPPPAEPSAPDPDALQGPDGAIAYADGAAWLPTDAARSWWEALHAEQRQLATSEPSADTPPDAGGSAAAPPPAPASATPVVVHFGPPPNGTRDGKRYWSLLGKADRVEREGNDKQAFVLRRQAKALEVPITESAELPAPSEQHSASPAPGSQALWLEPQPAPIPDASGLIARLRARQAPPAAAAE